MMLTNMMKQEQPSATAWSKDELRRIAEADDLYISPFREDGVTSGTPTWIWSVAVDDALYVRAYNGKSSRWYQAALQQKAGRITARIFILLLACFFPYFAVSPLSPKRNT